MRTAVANRWYLLETTIYKISLCTWKRCYYVKSDKIYKKYKIKCFLHNPFKLKAISLNVFYISFLFLNEVLICKLRRYD